MTKKSANPILSRRETLRLLGAAGTTAIVGWAGQPALRLLSNGRNNSTVAASAMVAPQQSCVVRPQLTEGPYFVDEKLNFTRPVE